MLQEKYREEFTDDGKSLNPITEKGTEVRTFHALETVEKTPAFSIANISTHITKQPRQINPLSLAEDMMKHDIPYPTEPIGYDNYTRWGEAKDGRQKKPYWARRFQGGCIYGSHKEGTSFSWFEEIYTGLSRAERRTLQQQANSFHKDIENQNKQKHEDISQEVQLLWDALSEHGESAYLEEKQVQAYGVRFEKKGKYTNLVIPLKDGSGKIWSIQRIYEDGRKSFYTGGRKSGCFHVIASLEGAGTAYVTEGYATGATVHQATEQPVIVVFDAGNMKKVVDSLRKEKPDLHLVLAIDNDHTKEQNTGLKTGEELQRKFNLPMVIPEFTEDDNREFYKTFHESPSDFNDLYRLKGLEYVSEALKNLRCPEIPVDEGLDDIFESPYKIIENQKGIEDGLYLEGTNPVTSKPYCVEVCMPPVKVQALSSNQGRGWKTLLVWKDRDNYNHQWVLDNSLLSDRTESWQPYLSGQGITIFKPTHLKNYIQMAQSFTSRRFTNITHSGWHNDNRFYVLPSGQTFGETTDLPPLFFEGMAEKNSSFETKGTLEEWQTHIAEPCDGNSRFMFSVSLALSAPMMPFLDIESGGFHFVGNSSCGKSTLLMVANSVWGNSRNKRSWHTTKNAIEGLAKEYNHNLLILDEISQADPQQIGETIYALANGDGKSRMNASSQMMKTNQWQTSFLSAGEWTIERYVKEGGKKYKGGQAMRLADIPADAGQNMGSAENIHEFPSSKQFIETLKTRSKRFYGTAGTAFLEKLVTIKDKLEDQFSEFLKEFETQVLPPDADPQIGRVLNRFAGVAFGGELAISWGILPWKTGSAKDASLRCFKDWLSERGGSSSSESLQIVQQFRHFIEQSEQSRFESLEGGGYENTIIHNRVGYWKIEQLENRDGEFLEEKLLFILPESFKDICRGFDPKFAGQVLYEKEILIAKSKESLTQSKYIKGRSARCYVLSVNRLLS